MGHDDDLHSALLPRNFINIKKCFNQPETIARHQVILLMLYLISAVSLHPLRFKQFILHGQIKQCPRRHSDYQPMLQIICHRVLLPDFTTVSVSGFSIPSSELKSSHY